MTEKESESESETAENSLEDAQNKKAHRCVCVHAVRAYQ